MLALLTGGLSVRAQSSLYSRDQIDQMVAPIALYPDALMSQVLMAATYPDQITEADQWVQANPDLTGKQLDDALATATWDPSVIALCKFPTVLDRMAQNLKWTSDLGNAFLNQKADVMDAIQTLRQAAYRDGHLRTTPQQRVIVQDRDIVIQPYTPDVIYVPAYQPAVVYGPVWSYPTYYYPTVWEPSPGASFVNGFFWGLGFTVGNVLFGGCDWYHHDVYVNNTVIVNNTIFHNTPYYRHGYWRDNRYGHHPWVRHAERAAYVRGYHRAPYGGRSHGRVRGIHGVRGRTHIDRTGLPRVHGPAGRFDGRTGRADGRRQDGLKGRASGRASVHGPTGRYARSNGRYTRDTGRTRVHGPAGRYASSRARVAPHGPTGRYAAQHGRSATRSPAVRSGRSNGRSAPHGPTGHYSRRYNGPPSVHGPSGYRPSNRGNARHSQSRAYSGRYRAPSATYRSSGRPSYRAGRPAGRAPVHHVSRGRARASGHARAVHHGGGHHKRR